LIYQHAHREADQQIAETLSAQLSAARAAAASRPETARGQHEPGEGDNIVISPGRPQEAPGQ
jgi:hypothetical protein